MKHSMQVAMCGLLGAVMVVVMLLGSIVPLTAIVCPAIAGLFLIPVIRECGRGRACMLYAGVAVLSVLLIPDKEVALLFALLLGPYPLLGIYLNRIRLRPLRIILKLLVCTALLTLIYTLLLLVLAPGALAAQLTADGLGVILPTMAAANAVFLLYDVCLERLRFLYEYKLRDKLLRAVSR